MSGWAIFGLVLLVLFALGQIRIGVGAEYTQDGLTVRARLGALRIKVFPLPKKEKKPKKKKPEKKPQNPTKPKGKEKTAQEKLEWILDLAQEFVPLALEAAGCFWHRLVVDRLELCLTIGSSDPADTAMLYGQANAALGVIWQPLTQAFHVREGRAHVQVDFEAQTVSLTGQTALSLKLGQILWLGLHFGVKALARFLQVRKHQKAKQQVRKAV